jgi:hypothetical protein
MNVLRSLFEMQMQMTAPHTYNALQNLVMAMAGVANKAGKKTFFGRDKGQEAYSKFLQMLKVTVHAMVLDGSIRESTPSAQVATALSNLLRGFADAYPNWPDAYGFAAHFFGDEESASATIERLRSTP